MSEKRFISEPIKLEKRTLEDGTVAEYISGTGIVFNKWSNVLTGKRSDGSRFKFIEKVIPEAVQGVNLDKVVSMVNHEITIGKRYKGTMDVEIDDVGVHYRTLIPNTTDGKNAREDVLNGNLEGSSFQFDIEDKGDIWDMTKKPFERTVTKMSLIAEMGPVNYPAYPDAVTYVRSFEENETAATLETETEERQAFEKRVAALRRKYNYSKLKQQYNK